MSKVLNQARGLRPGKSVFDLSYEHKTTMDLGYLYPMAVDEVIPGDVWSISCELVARIQPMAAPPMHPIYITVHYFFVPYRLLGLHEDVGFDWEDFITGGKAGTNAESIPEWDVTTNTEGSLWDYLGFPVGVDNANARPNKWPLFAYNMIWNQYFMDHDIDTEVDLDSNEALLKARWQRDYFTTARPYQQRGTAPAVDLSGIIEVDGQDDVVTGHLANDATVRNLEGVTVTGALRLSGAPGGATSTFRWDDPQLEVDLTGTSSVDINDLRLVAAIQQYMELSMQSGYRYTEYLKAFYGESPRDDRLDRAEYIGGMKAWFTTSEVLQTSESGATPQGNMVGHGICVASDRIGSYRVKEHGLIMGVMCIRPTTVYEQGIDRQWLRESRYDYYNPLFAGLSEQEVLTRELYCDAAHELTVFGYQQRFAEHRVKKSRVSGGMHSDYDHYHLSRQFSAQPTLNAGFLECTPREDFLADSGEPAFVVSFGNIVRAVRPMPMVATPGLGRI